MRKAALFTFLTLALALPSLADERHQSFLSYDDGGTIIRSGEDGQEVEAHRNLPIYPGDEVITARRGRAEIRLSDGNIIGIDRATALRFRSILDSYEGDSNETVAELKYGKVAVHRTDLGRDHVRLDTDNASYVAEYEAVYSVETDSRGRDRVMVFDGSIEVRTPSRSTRLRGGESANVDDRGAYDLTGDVRESADDFERWFLRRAERFGTYDNRYMDRRLSYWGDDLDDHGRWVFVTGIGWSWRPFVAVGWRPYYNGYWYNRHGCMTWVSYDPWGWAPYHYGRWAYDPGYGWVWVPGYGYAPAWVYWTFGSGYVGWAPAGWWDCYRPYYGWAYNPYRDYGTYMGWGFYGRVRVSDFDLRPWTFIDSRNIMSTRVDRAALTMDAVKQRLGRSRDGYTVVAGGAGRFTREEWNDPAEAIRRRGLDGRSTGRETGAPPTDLTPFFRRDGEVSGTVRDRVVRAARGGSGSGGTGIPSRAIGGGSGSVAPIGGGSVAPIGRGSIAPIGPGTATGGRSGDTGSGTVNRGNADTGRRSGDTDSGRVSRGRVIPPVTEPADVPTDTGRSTPNWRDRGRDRAETPQVEPPPTTSTTPPPSGDTGRSDTWRRRVRSDDGGSSSGSTSSGSTSDVPRRVIDRIGGARIYPRDSDGGGRSSASGDSGRRSGGSSSGSGVRSGGGSSGGGSSSGGSSTRSGGSSGGGSSSGGSSGGRSTSSGSSSRGESGGRVKRD